MNIALTQIFIDTLQSHFQIAKTLLETIHALVQYFYVAPNFDKLAPDIADFAPGIADFAPDIADFAPNIAESIGERPCSTYRDTAHQHQGH